MAAEFDLLRFSTFADIQAEASIHNILGITRHLTDSWEISLEVYNKELQNLIVQDFEFQETAITKFAPNPILSTFDRVPASALAYEISLENRFTRTTLPTNAASSNAYGVDFRIEKKANLRQDWWFGAFSYSFSKATREENINGIRQNFPLEFDRRHSINGNVHIRLGEHFLLGVNWKYGSGFPFTPAIRPVPLIGFGKTNDPNAEEEGNYFVMTDPETGFARFIPDFGGPENINSARYPDYHRIDVRAGYSSRVMGMNIDVYLDLINIFNRKNVLFYQNVIKIVGNEPHLPLSLRFPKPALFKRPVYMLPFVPSLGFSVRF